MDTGLAVQQSTFLSPAINMTGAMERYNAMNQFIAGILKDGVDYGKVPGSDKPTLLKPGAEKLASFFGLSPHFNLDEKVEDWTGENHGGEPFFYYRYKCQLFKGELMIAEGEGSCNSWEKKYRYRQGTRTCPECGQPSIFKSKNNPEYYCWNKKGGCGATFKLTDDRINSQEIGQTKNPDPAEQVNTIQKMAQKRALIAPVLIATNASEKFTQDIEDFVDADFHEVIPEPPQPKPQQKHTPPAPTGDRPYSPDALKARIQVLADSFAGETCTDKQRTSVRINLAEMAGGEDNYHTLLAWLIGTPHIADATTEQVLALKKWIHSTKQPDDTWIADAMAIQEAKSAYTEALKAQGQAELL